MIVLEDLTAEVPDTNAYCFNLKKFSNERDKVVLMYGYNSSNNTDLKVGHHASTLKKKITMEKAL